MKKIYILINHFQTQDGVARTAVGLANELAKRGHQVTLQSLFKFEPGMKSWLLPQVEAKPFCGFYLRSFYEKTDSLFAGILHAGLFSRVPRFQRSPL